MHAALTVLIFAHRLAFFAPDTASPTVRTPSETAHTPSRMGARGEEVHSTGAVGSSIVLDGGRMNADKHPVSSAGG